MAGLDPAIHTKAQRMWTFIMDHRVKPGDDEGYWHMKRRTPSACRSVMCAGFFAMVPLASNLARGILGRSRTRRHDVVR